jgi:hypothetical protein
MHTTEQRVAMMLDRLARAADDPAATVVEAVLLRTAFERIDDWLLWLDGHVAAEHTNDDASAAVLQMLGGVRHKLARELRLVDHVLDRISE